MRIGIVVACVLASVAAGCGAAGRGAEPGQHSQAVLPPSHQVHPHPAASDQSELAQRGIDVLWYYDPGDAYPQIEAKANATFAYIRHLGGNAAAISFPLFMASSTASQVAADPSTPSPAQMAIAVRSAEQHGLRVIVRPEIDGYFATGWRGTIEPASRAEWFASYFSVLRPYLAMAQRTGAAQFEIGVELNSLTGDKGWGPLIASARRIFHGVIGYSSNWNMFARSQFGPRQVNSQDLDAYFPLTLPSDATVGQLASAWQGWLAGAQARINLSNVVIAETGIAAQAGAYQHPYGPGDAGLPINAQIQQRWFAAACQFAIDWHMRGIYFWYLDFNNPPGSFNPATAPPMSFVGRSARTIEACFSGR
jgi:hypothetical protein